MWYSSFKGENDMPTKNPRINLTVEKKLYDYLNKLAKEEGQPVSSYVKGLLLEVLAIKEDLALGFLAEDRLKNTKKEDYIEHDEFWKKTK